MIEGIATLAYILLIVCSLFGVIGIGMVGHLVINWFQSIYVPVPPDSTSIRVELQAEIIDDLKQQINKLEALNGQLIMTVAKRLVE